VFRRHFSLPLPQSIEFCLVVVLPHQASPTEAHCVVGQETLVGLSRVVSAIRRFPLKSEGSSSLVLKLRLDLHGVLGEEGPPLKDVSFEARYERLAATLSAVVVPPTTSAATKKSPGLPRLSSSKVGPRVLSSRPNQSDDSDIVVASPKEGVVAEIYVQVGDPLLYGTLVATIEECLAEQQEESELLCDIPVKTQVAYLGAEMYETTTLYERPAEMKHEADVHRKDCVVLQVLWQQKDPGIVTCIKAAVGLRVTLGSSLVVASVSRKSQHVALLTAADRLAFLSDDSGSTSSSNAKFQSVTERLVSLTASGFQPDGNDVVGCCGELEQLARDFLDTARTYGRVIISEMHLPIGQKTIRPLKLGGVLGGQKYVVRGILFKIPDGTMFAKYPDPMHIANKVQGHELKGLKAYFGWFFNRGNVGLVSFPLMALIDYKGHRITAMT
jgi:biotin carboxyl carrier protein